MSAASATSPWTPANRRPLFRGRLLRRRLEDRQNAGVTWSPSSTPRLLLHRCVAMDPRNPSVVWVGTGENNAQRSVGFGDGNLPHPRRRRPTGKTSASRNPRHRMILIDPLDSDTVYVAAQGPLWRDGGDRGLYKTTDSGKTWERILHISDQTGVNEVHADPRDPDVLYATAWQRRRHVWTLIDGGPESAIYKSTDAGATWRKLSTGLPEVDLGRIGLDVAPADPDVVYAIVEAADDKSGFFRSTDRGETWSSAATTRPPAPSTTTRSYATPRSSIASTPRHLPPRHPRRRQDVSIDAPPQSPRR